jgi:hypothetical protein
MAWSIDHEMGTNNYFLKYAFQTKMDLYGGFAVLVF